MPERDMTPEERERFEREEVQGQEGQPFGPASESEQLDLPKHDEPSRPPIPPGPD